ncbi:CmpA/NrtA family ABC transporter substrate-binding protein [Marinibaculum pumilum]|uniref:CmpA/NrtA family ABC transporter substrate-binding protein n=1 Tax=Marinibaculum pumilum TaxID=1766165 RepID=A0ABV7L8L1_9PROT
MAQTERLRIGFIPLLDAALPIVAGSRGFAEAEGLDLELVRESSWANIRERVAIGHVQAAHMLAPMPIAASLGLGPLDVPLVAPMALGLGGNAITVSTALWAEMQAQGAGFEDGAAAIGAALRQALTARRKAGAEPPTFAIVHPFSAHNYELRYWLAGCGIAPDRDVRLVVVPPPFAADALAAGRLDGFCVGEPWNSVAVAAGCGVIATSTAAIWRSSAEKVLGIRADWAEANPALLARLVRALAAAAAWCGDPANTAELAELLSGPAFLDRPAALLQRGLTGRLSLAPGTPPAAIADFLTFHDRAATFPWISHALWFYSQMVRWGQVTHGAAALAKVRQVYRPDLYRAALQDSGIALPAASAKVEGALTAPTMVSAIGGSLALGPDGFFDGRQFDPDLIEDYLSYL